LAKHPKSLELGTDDHLLRWVDQYYKQIIDQILYFQRITEYSGDIFNLLFLPYNLFQDLVLAQTKIKHKEKQLIDEQLRINEEKKHSISGFKRKFKSNY
jgi:hypothetical protein